MIKEIKYWICTECNYISYTPIIKCPACSCKKTYNIKTVTGTKKLTNEKYKILTGDRK